MEKFPYLLLSKLFDTHVATTGASKLSFLFKKLSLVNFSDMTPQDIERKYFFRFEVNF